MPDAASDRPRVLLLAYACIPEIGSEPGLGWNRALQTAKYFSAWVLCDERLNRDKIEQFVALHGPIPRLQFVFVPPVRSEERLRRMPGGYYAAYNLWHRRAYAIAQELHERVHFDLVHQVSLCGFREPGYLWKLEPSFVWGPVGGAQYYPWRFLLGAGPAGALREALRNVLNFLQVRYARRVGLAARKAAVMLAASTTNAREMAPRRGVPLRVMLETGAHPLATPAMRNFNHGGPLRLLWSGVFEHRKALHLLLAALEAMPSRVEYELRILGRGPLEKRWRLLAKRRGVERHCRWLGWLDPPEVVEQYLWADAFVFTSLRDTSGNVVLESLTCGTPVLCLDHQGMADVITDECGVKLPVTTPTEVVAGLKDALVRWHGDRNELARLSRGALRRAQHYSWERQGERMAAVYREVLGVGIEASQEQKVASSSEGDVESQLDVAPARAAVAVNEPGNAFKRRAATAPASKRQ